MNLKEFICKLFKRRDDAKRNAESADVGVSDCLRRRCRLNEAELQIAARAIRYAD